MLHAAGDFLSLSLFPLPPYFSFVIVWLLSRTFICHVYSQRDFSNVRFRPFCSRDAVAARSMMLGDDEVVAPVRARVDRVFDDQVAPELASSF